MADLSPRHEVVIEDANGNGVTVTNNRLDANSFVTNTVANPVPVQISGGSSRPAKSKLYEFTGNQTLTTILTPASGKKIDLYFCAMTSDDSSGAKVVVRFNTSNQNVFIDWTKTAASPAQLVNFQGNTNEVLSLTVTGLNANKNGVIYIGYDEVT